MNEDSREQAKEDDETSLAAGAIALAVGALIGSPAQSAGA